MLILLYCLSQSQERRHWFIFVGIRVSFTNFDVNDGVSLAIPLTLDHRISPCLFLLVTPLTDMPLWYVMDLMDYESGVY